MPRDSDLALFERGIDADLLTRARDLLVPAASDALAEDGIKEADRKTILEALGKIPTAAPLAYASGVDVELVKKAGASVRPADQGGDPTQTLEGRRAAAEALLGWRVLEIDEPPARLEGVVRELVSAWGRPAVSAAFRAKKSGAPPPAFHPAPMPKGALLPKDTQHYVLELPPPGDIGGTPAAAKPKPRAGGEPARKPLVVHVFIAPDGARTWVGLGGGEALVVSKLAVALSGTGDNLGVRAEVAGLKSESVGAGGFLTPRGLPEMGQLLATLLGAWNLEGLEPIGEAGALPHQGTTAIPFSLTAQPGAKPTSVVAMLRIPRDVIEDAVVLVLRHGGI
jgi:hypothetical protein